MRIPVFVSSPTKLNERQETSRELVVRELARLQLEPRALGRSDYPSEFPLREVFVIARHCSGGIILGFQQLTATAGFGRKEPKRSGGFGAASRSAFLPLGIILKLEFFLACSCRF